MWCLFHALIWDHKPGVGLGSIICFVSPGHLCLGFAFGFCPTPTHCYRGHVVPTLAHHWSEMDKMSHTLYVVRKKEDVGAGGSTSWAATGQGTLSVLTLEVQKQKNLFNQHPGGPATQCQSYWMSRTKQWRINKCVINDYCAKQDELYSLQASSSSFKWVLECPANYRDFGDSTASTSFLGKAAKAASVTPLMSQKNGSYSPSSIYSCIYSIQYRIINSKPFKTTLMSWFSQQISA